MNDVLRAKAQGLVVSGHLETVRLFVNNMIADVRNGSVLGEDEFATVRNAASRDAKIEALQGLINRIESAASAARVTKHL